MYHVIYYWRGEAHRHLAELSLVEANRLAAEMHADGWRVCVRRS